MWAQDVIGIIMWVTGFLIEVVGDQQKYSWKSARPPRGEINDKGIWVRTSPRIVVVELTRVRSDTRDIPSPSAPNLLLLADISQLLWRDPAVVGDVDAGT